MEMTWYGQQQPGSGPLRVQAFHRPSALTLQSEARSAGFHPSERETLGPHRTND